MRVSNRDIALRPALCLDFDGTIRKSKSGTFIKDEKDIELMPGIEKIIWMYRNMGFLIIGISNQGGV
jgi:histidinol phosphatase-like enzyme